MKSLFIFAKLLLLLFRLTGLVIKRGASFLTLTPYVRAVRGKDTLNTFPFILLFMVGVFNKKKTDVQDKTEYHFSLRQNY